MPAFRGQSFDIVLQDIGQDAGHEKQSGNAKRMVSSEHIENTPHDHCLPVNNVHLNSTLAAQDSRETLLLVILKYQMGPSSHQTQEGDRGVKSQVNGST